MTTRRQVNLGLVSLIAPLLAAPHARAAANDEAAFPQWLASLEAQAGGRLGVAVLDTQTGRIVGHRLDERFPMCSTFKALAAAAVLARVDRGQDQLDRRVKYSASILVPYSPVTKQHAERDGMALADICAAAVTLSDNTAGNLMLEAIGGPPGLTAYLRSIGDEVGRLDRTEPTLNEARPGDPRDTNSPRAMTQTLHRLVLGDALKPASRQLLKRWLVECRTGDARLRAGLGRGWTVGDKTGTANDAATANDVGVLWPPAGRAPLVVTVFTTHADRIDPKQRDAQIARIAKRTAELLV